MANPSKRSLEGKARAAQMTPEQKQSLEDRKAAGRRAAFEKRQAEAAEIQLQAPLLVEKGRQGMPTPEQLRGLPLHKVYQQLGLRSPEQKESGHYAAVPDLCLPKLGIDCIDLAIVIEFWKREWFSKEKGTRNLPFPSSETISANIGVDPRTVQRRIDAMEAKGYCRKLTRPNGWNTSLKIDWTGLLYAQRAVELERPAESADKDASTVRRDGTQEPSTVRPDVTAPSGVTVQHRQARRNSTVRRDATAPSGVTVEGTEAEETEKEETEFGVTKMEDLPDEAKPEEDGGSYGRVLETPFSDLEEQQQQQQPQNLPQASGVPTTSARLETLRRTYQGVPPESRHLFAFMAKAIKEAETALPQSN